MYQYKLVIKGIFGSKNSDILFLWLFVYMIGFCGASFSFPEKCFGNANSYLQLVFPGLQG